MDRDVARDIYDKCMNMDLTEMVGVIKGAESAKERAFYLELYNYVMHVRAKECIENGVY